MPTHQHITLPGGFTAAGVRCGLKQADTEDLAVIACDRDASAAVALTTNQVVGAPVLWCRQLLPDGRGKVRGMVINAGCSNVCTGKQGLKDARRMAARTAKGIGADADQILVASTGIIGQRLPMQKIRAGIEDACSRLDNEQDEAVARAILTTDLKTKSAFEQVTVGGKKATVAGVCKGSGMIAPSLATMIGAITTDVAITPAALHKALLSAVDDTFNAVTVDTDTSTSDTVAVLASGEAGNKPLTARSEDFLAFVRALREVCNSLAWQIAADGEGATRVIEVRVRNAGSREEAKLAARSVADSPLVKTAVHGCDPNWGRIVMALGKSAAEVDPDRLRVKLAGVTVFSKGTGRRFDPDELTKKMTTDVLTIECDLGLGTGEYTALTCDLTREYIAINADYHT
jgi:glutamate N-acetyltransferase/amino-acid N-acetyltransferase